MKPKVFKDLRIKVKVIRGRVKNSASSSNFTIMVTYNDGHGGNGQGHMCTYMKILWALYLLSEWMYMYLQ